MATKNKTKQSKEKCLFYCIDLFQPGMLEKDMVNPPPKFQKEHMDDLPGKSLFTAELEKQCTRKRTGQDKYKLVSTVGNIRVYLYCFGKSIAASSAKVNADFLLPVKVQISWPAVDLCITEWKTSDFVPVSEIEPEIRRLKLSIMRKESMRREQERMMERMRREQERMRREQERMMREWMEYTLKIVAIKGVSQEFRPEKEVVANSDMASLLDDMKSFSLEEDESASNQQQDTEVIPSDIIYRSPELLQNQRLARWIRKNSNGLFFVQEDKHATEAYTIFNLSKDDIAIFSKDIFEDATVIGEATLSACVISPMNEDDEIAVQCGSLECKTLKQDSLDQLIGNLVKTAGELAYQSIIHSKLFNKIVIYGLRISYETNQSCLYRLFLDFRKGNSTLYEDIENLNITSGVKKMLSLLKPDISGK